MKKPVEIWRPGAIPTAEKAATAAKDYEADSLWQPEKSAAGSKAAAAASDHPPTVQAAKAPDISHRHSAAEKATRKMTSPQTDHSTVTDHGNRKALMAATGAMAESRRRSGSAPVAPFQPSPAGPSSPLNNAQWALKAANQSQRVDRSGSVRKSKDYATEPTKIQNPAQVSMNRQMFTSHPPVSVEVEERKRQDTLRASAVAMAQTMYGIQKKVGDDAKTDVATPNSHLAAQNVHKRRTSDASSVSTQPERASSALYSIGLQETAQRLAKERIAKMRDEQEEFKSYYGQTSPPPRSRLSIQSKLRRRASSDGAADKIDEQQSRRIRSQMSTFQKNLDAVDGKKRQDDRGALMAAAQRKVRASMHSMDDRVFQETGKSSPAQQEAWAAQAREKAQAESDARMEHFGKVNVGAGKYIDQSDVDAVAKNRVQPTLNEIDENAEAQRAREEEERLDREAEKHRAEVEKQRTAELKAEQKRAHGKVPRLDFLHGWLIAATAEEKRQDKARKAEEKKFHRDDGKQGRSETAAADHISETADDEAGKKLRAKDKAKGLLSSLRMNAHHAGSSGIATSSSQSEQPASLAKTSSSAGERQDIEAVDETQTDLHEEPREQTGPIDQPTEEETAAPPASPSKRQSRMKSWFAERLRRPSKGVKGGESEEQAKKAGFLSKASRGSTSTDSRRDQDGDQGAAGDDSVRNVALAGRSRSIEEAREKEAERPVSPLSDQSEENKKGLRSDREDSVSISSSSDKGVADNNNDDDRQRRSDDELGSRGRGMLTLREMIFGSGDRTHKDVSADHVDNEHSIIKDVSKKEDIPDDGEDRLEPPPKIGSGTASGSSSKASASPVRDSKFSENL